MKILLIVLLAIQAQPAEKKESGQEVLNQAQGTWARDVSESPVPNDRMVKRIEGNTETFSIYRGDELVFQQEVDFEIDVQENVTIFTLRNVKITAGAQKGETREGNFSYLLQLRDDRWIEVQGLMNGDQAAPKLSIYRRVDPDDVPRVDPASVPDQP